MAPAFVDNVAISINKYRVAAARNQEGSNRPTAKGFTDKPVLALIEWQLIEPLQVVDEAYVIRLHAVGTKILGVVSIVRIDAVVGLGIELGAHRPAPSEVGVNSDTLILARG